MIGRHDLPDIDFAHRVAGNLPSPMYVRQRTRKATFVTGEPLFFWFRDPLLDGIARL